MTKIHWAAELRISYLQLTRNEHNPVIFLKIKKPVPSGLAFHLCAYQVNKTVSFASYNCNIVQETDYV